MGDVYQREVGCGGGSTAVQPSGTAASGAAGRAGTAPPAPAGVTGSAAGLARASAAIAAVVRSRQRGYTVSPLLINIVRRV